MPLQSCVCPPFVLAFLYCLSSVGAQEPTRSYRNISGKIIDAQSRQPLAGANIVADDSSFGVASNRRGEFALKVSHRAGSLMVQYIGYQPARIFLRPTASDTFVAVAMLAAPIALPDVNVEAERETPTSNRVRLESRELKEIPDFTGDVLTAAKTLPGVASNNEMTGGFSAQGGSPEENLILLEGMEINRPLRLRTSSQENIAPINKMLVENLTFTAGGFPARFGERLSSVLLAHYRERSDQKIRGEAEISLLNVDLMLEGQPNARWHWALATRVSDRRLLLRTLQTDGEFSPRAYDVQGILHGRLSRRHRLQLLALHGENLFTARPESQQTSSQIGYFLFVNFRTSFAGHEKFTHRFSHLAAQLTSELSPRFSLQQLLAAGKTFEHEDTDLSRFTQQDGVLISAGAVFRNDRLQENYCLYQGQLRWIISSRLDAEAGWRYLRRHYDDQLADLERETPTPFDSTLSYGGYRYETRGASALSTRALAIFGSSGANLSRRWRLDAGWRYNYYENSNEHIFQPRAALTFVKDERTTMDAAWGRYAQPAGYHEMRADGYQPRHEVPAQRATHYVAGIQRRGSAGNEWQIQCYYKRLDRLIPYRVEDIFIRFQPDLKAEGTIYGASWHWRNNLSKRWTSRLTYTYMQGRQNIAGEGQSRLPTDQRHTFAAVFQDNMPSLPRSRMHIRFLFGSGYPFTPLYAKPDSSGATKTLAEANRNTFRHPFYRRIDLGMSYDWTLSPRVEARFSFEIFNIFDFRNRLSYAAFLDATGRAWYAPVNLSRRLFNARVNLQFPGK
jgi:hypothetical protein